MANNVPRKVQEQLERAEELHRQMYQEQPAEQAESAPGSEGAHEDAQQNAPKQAEETRETAPQIDQNGYAEESEGWEEKFRKLEAMHKTLQGKYRAEVPVMAEKIRNLQAQLSQSQNAQAQAEKTAQTANEKLKEITERIRVEVGDDGTNAIAEYTSELVKSEMNDFKKEQQNDSLNKFWSFVRGRVPNFDEVNVLPEFESWLQSTDDPLTGLTMKEAINAAGQSLDGLRVVEITQTFLRAKDNARTTSQTKRTTPDDHVSLPRKTVPRKPESNPQYTPSDYAKLQDEIRRGLWRGKEAEARQLETEIHAAIFGT